MMIITIIIIILILILLILILILLILILLILILISSSSSSWREELSSRELAAGHTAASFIGSLSDPTRHTENTNKKIENTNENTRKYKL